MRDFDKFVEEAIKTAGEAGERKRKFRTQTASSLAASRMAELERAETGATRRLGMKEAGLGRRLGREQEFARPKQRAEISRLGALEGLRGAEAEEVRYGTEFERGTRGTLEDILRSRGRQVGAGAREAELGVSEMERDIRLRDEAEERAEIEAAMPSTIEPEAPAEPGRKMRPGLKKALWGGEPYRGGVGFFGSPKGYFDVAEMLKSGIKRGYEYAFPRTK